MSQETAQKDLDQLFHNVSSRCHLEYLATEWGSPLIPSKQAELRDLIEKRKNMRVEYDKGYDSLRKKVSEAEELSQHPELSIRQKAREETVELAERLVQERKELEKLDREIANKADSLIRETKKSSPKPQPQPKRPFL